MERGQIRRGREIFTLLRGRKTRIGVSDELQIDSRPFTDMYPGWAGDNVQLHLDAGLIRVDDLADWTTQVLGMGPMDEIADLTQDSLTLGIIDCEVRGFGGAELASLTTLPVNQKLCVPAAGEEPPAIEAGLISICAKLSEEKRTSVENTCRTFMVLPLQAA